MNDETTDPMTEPWGCWRCGGRHARRHQRCPRAGVNDGAPTRAEMFLRLQAFIDALPMALADRVEEAWPPTT